MARQVKRRIEPGVSEQVPEPVIVVPKFWRSRKFGPVRFRTTVSPPVNGDGITVRTYWFLLPKARTLEFVLVTLALSAEIGRRGKRAPGTWGRLLTNWWRWSGRAYSSYCPDLPPQWTGFLLVVPCLQVGFNWHTQRQHAVVHAHLLEPCPTCDAAGRRLPPQPAT
ncbi:hypothetical protein ACIOFY_36880 [Streptomyces anulatus]